MGAIISEIKQEQVNCIVGPDWPTSWKAVLHGNACSEETVLVLLLA